MMASCPPSRRFKSVLDRPEAVEVLQDWWQDGPKARGLEVAGEIEACTPYYVPFWCTEWEATVYVDVSLEETFRRSPVKVVYGRRRTWTDVACDPGEVGVSFLPTLQGETVPDERCVVRELGVSVPEDESVARQRKMTEDAIIKEVDKDYSSAPKRLALDLLACTLVYYPLWVARYTYQGRAYQATIDGVTGEVLAGRAPGDLLVRLCTGAGVLLVCAVGAAIWIWLLRTFGWIGALMIGSVVFLVCLGVVWWQYSFLRYGSMIVTGQAEGGYRYGEELATEEEEP
ncbi:hypothetical protein J2129_000845 [Methanofollis sp. W23]|uniref:hypothetical protein n=1 Tax=Methanofollis sp. W23 TaxID=2817849 RepID=UPI001AE81BA8|nr:hypothetical protein [Methanofollis sp. W23]MBP2145391.1 hypothetical protein [Methanofollis sp. W23]